MITSFLLGVAPLLATNGNNSGSKTTSGGSSSLSFIIIIVLFVAVYFFFIRPRTQRAKQQQAKGKDFALGDEVMSVGGIFGTVVGLGDDSVDVQVADDVVLTFLRRAVNPRPTPAAGSSSRGSFGGSQGRTSSSGAAGGPYGGSDETAFGASSGHFGDDLDGTSQEVDALDGDAQDGAFSAAADSSHDDVDDTDLEDTDFEDTDFEDTDFEDTDFADADDDDFDDEDDDSAPASDGNGASDGAARRARRTGGHGPSGGAGGDGA